MKNKVGRILFGVWAIFLLVLLVFVYVPKQSNGKREQSVAELSVWVQKEDETEEKVTLPKDLNEKKTNTIEIYTSLPKEFENAQMICFWTDYREVEVFLDSKTIYCTDKNEKFGKASVSRWNYVEIPENSAGKKITIVMNTPYEKKSCPLNEVVYGSPREVERWLHKTYGGNQKIDIALMAAGIIFIFCGVFQNVERRYRICHIYFGITAIFIGFWLRMGTKGLPVYGMSPVLYEMLDGLLFYLIPIPLIMCVKMRIVHKKLLLRICDVLLGIQCLIVLFVHAMQALGIRDIQENVMIDAAKLVVNTGGLTKNSELLTIRADIISRVCIVLIIILAFISLFRSLYEKEKIQKKIQEDNRNLQLQLLTGQIRPHFILNTLGAIRSLITQDAERASELLYDFSKYIRKNMEQKDYNKKIPFLEELDYIETYLHLEELRFNDRLKVEYDIQERSFWILPLTIQPFIENAVKHGLLEQKEGGTVRISTYRKGKSIVIEIKDDGVGFDTMDFWNGLEERKSVGMKSAIFRLQHGMSAKCDVESTRNPANSGTCIRITIPEKGASRNENHNRR